MGGFLTLPLSAHPLLSDGGSSPKANCRNLNADPLQGSWLWAGGRNLWVTRINVNVPAVPSEPATLCPCESYLLLMHLGK